jgi:HD-GYP domain-containing protein (c-di-GMP phosphodiesterase class II)
MDSEKEYKDLRLLDINAPLSRKLLLFYNYLHERFETINHIAVAVYDSKTDIVKTFLDTKADTTLLRNYQAKLSEAHSLANIAETGKARIINDLEILGDSEKEHTRLILAAGYKASYTMPMFFKGELYGFIFFNSNQRNAFDAHIVAFLDCLGRLLSFVVISELRTIQILSAAVRTTREVISKRDCETGSHLERMSRYCRLIARQLAKQFDLTDEYIEYLYLFSPLHDIGKIAIPDKILLKPGPLTADELAVMQTHTISGVDMIDVILREFKFTELPYTDLLRNIVLYHHEAVDGSGYPHGLKRDEIPLESRIVTTADVFDALTSRRPYKEAWSIEQTFDEMYRISNKKLDLTCVEALYTEYSDILSIQEQFVETIYG